MNKKALLEFVGGACVAGSMAITHLGDLTAIAARVIVMTLGVSLIIAARKYK